MTPTDPPPGLLDKMAEAIADARVRTTFAEDLARAAWDAMAEGLGLSEETQRGECEIDLREHDDRACEPGPDRRRLVSKWEPRP